MNNIQSKYHEKSELHDTYNEQNIYKLSNVHRNKNGNHIVSIKISDAPRGIFQTTAIDLITKNKDRLKNFSVDDIIKITGIAYMENEPQIIKYQANSQHKCYTFLTVIFIIALVAANFAASKLIFIFGYIMAGGVFVFPISYCIGDIVTEV